MIFFNVARCSLLVFFVDKAKLPRKNLEFLGEKNKNFVEKNCKTHKKYPREALFAREDLGNLYPRKQVKNCAQEIMSRSVQGYFS